MRKTIHQILEHQKKADNALIMNSEQRLERLRLLNAAEFGAACLDHWPEIQNGLRLLCAEQSGGLDGHTATLNKLMYLYEVAK